MIAGGAQGSDFLIADRLIHGRGLSLVEDQPVEVVGDVGERQFRLGPGDANGSDEEPEAVLLMGEDMHDAARIEDLAAFAVAMFCGIGFPAGLRRWMRLTSIFDASHFSFFRER